MFKNYLKIAFRSLWKHRVFSLINIMGLTIGMTACFLIFLYVKFEGSYDAFNTKADRIYRMVSDIKTPSETIHASGPAWAVIPNMFNEFPEVEYATRVRYESFLLRKGTVKYQEENSMLADSTFFNVFDYKLIHGNPATALTEPMSIVLSRTAAKKYFGDVNPVGQTVLFTGDGFNAKITGLMEDMPENSHLKADMLVSMSTVTKNINPDLDKQWGAYGLSAYLLLKPGSDAKALEKKFPGFLQRHNGDEMKQQQMYPTLLLEKLRDVYLRSTRNGKYTGSITNVYIFSIIAVFILLIACINFVNLTTARSSERAREVGIRKVVGAAKWQLAGQFTGESVLLCLIAFVFTIALSSLLLPAFNQLAGKIITTIVFAHTQYIFLLFCAAVGIGLLAGIYPAMVLSSFRPSMFLKGRFATGGKGVFLRKGLVVAQFTISIVLITGTIIVYNQMQYMRKQDLGFSKDQLMIINTNGDPGKAAFKQSLHNIPGIKSVSIASSVPGGNNSGAYSEIENSKGDLQIANLDLYLVDFDYLSQFDMKMVAGRAFQKDFATDSTQAMVLNETAVKLFGYASPQQAIGRRFKQWDKEGKIVGVVKDFHFRSLQQQIKPLSIRIDPEGSDFVSVKLSTADIKTLLSGIENKWKAAIPNRPFSYYFLDEFFDRQYRSEEQFGKLFLNFAILAIFISCLGLLGLASYSTRQRTKEIGVRKVMGASVGNIVQLLSKDFLRLVIISFIIAIPLSGYFMNQWLKDFAYRTTLSWWIFAIAGLIAVCIAIFTVSFQAIKAAIANPVKSLRTE